MANQEQLEIIGRGSKVWNAWRKNNPSELQIDLRGANLKEAHLDGVNLLGADLDGANLVKTHMCGADLCYANLHNADLRGADLRKANLSDADLFEANLTIANLSQARFIKANFQQARLTGAKLIEANLSYANLTQAGLREASLNRANLERAVLERANLNRADLYEANLFEACLDGANLRNAYLDGANLQKADLQKADFSGANLQKADLSGANLKYSLLIDVDVDQTILKGCHIYGISAWNIFGNPQDQSNLVITRSSESRITVDDLQVAQFVYLLLNNKNVRSVIDTITSKAVLILGRFTNERKMVLDAIRSELRKRNYLPILFDFNGPQNRDITETVSTLAHMAKFVIADITDAKSIPQELSRIVPLLPSVPVQPLLLTSQREYGMFEHFKRYPWVLEICHYENADSLISSIEERVLQPVENWLEANKRG